MTTSTVKRGFADTRLGQVHYRIAGAGAPLILLHQSTRSSTEFRFMIPILARTRRVVAMDIPGFGDSDRPAKPPSIPEFAGSVIDLMDALGIKKASLVGHHTGAYILGEVAAAYPDRVDKLVLEGCFSMDAEERKRQDGKMPQMQIKEDGSHLIPRFQSAVKSTGDVHEASIRVLDALKAGEAGVYGFWAVFKWEQEKRLSLVKCPTLLVWGLEDLKVVDNMGWNATRDRPKVDALLPHAKVIVIPEAGHFIPEEIPERFAQMILDFLGDGKA